MPPESFWVFKVSLIKKNMDIHKMKECKRNAISKYLFSRNSSSGRFYFGPLVSAALKCYFRDNGHKI